MSRTENYLREFYKIFFAQKKLIFGTTLIFLIFSLLVVLLKPPIYSASGSILVKGKKLEKNPSVLEKTLRRDVYPVTKADLTSEKNILLSHDVIKLALDYLQEKGVKKEKMETPTIIVRMRERLKGVYRSFLDFFERLSIYGAGSGLTKVEKEIYSVKRNLKTEVIPVSNVIKVTYYDENPRYAVALVDALMHQYLLYRGQIGRKGQAVELFFQDQSERYKKILKEKEEELIRLVGTNDVADPQKEIENNLSLRKALEERLTTLKTKYNEKKLYIKRLDKALASEKGLNFFSFIPADEGKIINYLGEKLSDAIVEKEKMLKVFKSGSSKIKHINREIKNLYMYLRREVVAYRNSQVDQAKVMKENIVALEGELQKIRKMNVKLKKLLVNMESIKRDIAMLASSYETVSKRREEEKIDSSVIKANLSYYVNILSSAFPSEGPVFPKKSVVIPLGVLIGFILGCVFGFLREYFDHTFSEPWEVEEIVGVPVLFSIPKSGKQKVGKSVVAIGVLFVVLFLLSSWYLLDRKCITRNYNISGKNKISIASN